MSLIDVTFVKHHSHMSCQMNGRAIGVHTLSISDAADNNVVSSCVEVRRRLHVTSLLRIGLSATP